MASLPVVSGKEAVKAFENDGWTQARRARSTHFYLVKPGFRFKLSIPDHDTLDRGLLRSQIKLAGLTVEQFVALLDA